MECAATRAWIYMEHHAPDAPFLEVYADADGHYSACGIPANTRIAFETSKTGYVYSYIWRQFSADATLDIELTRQ